MLLIFPIWFKLPSGYIFDLKFRKATDIQNHNYSNNDDSVESFFRWLKIFISSNSHQKNSELWTSALQLMEIYKPGGIQTLDHLLQWRMRWPLYSSVLALLLRTAWGTGMFRYMGICTKKCVSIVDIGKSLWLLAIVPDVRIVKSRVSVVKHSQPYFE
jgi:hypothetical protein